MPEDVLMRRRPVEIDVPYRAEAFCGDTLLPLATAGASGPGPVFLRQIANASTGAELTRLRIRWE